MLEQYIGRVVGPEPWPQYGLFTGDVVDNPSVDEPSVYMDKAEADLFYEDELDAFREAIFAASTSDELDLIYELCYEFDRLMEEYVPQWIEEPTAKLLMHDGRVRGHAAAIHRKSRRKAALIEVGYIPRIGGAHAPMRRESDRRREPVASQS
jgi:hypothetical protein